MDARGLRASLTGAVCTSCGVPVPIDRIVVLADRGDVAFVELDCTACGSRTMGVVIAAPSDDASPVLDTAGHPELDPDTAARLASRPAVGDEDVLAMRRLLATWTGDLRSLIDVPGSDGAP